MRNKDTVLIVEDEANIAGFIDTILSANQFEVLKARDGTEALMMISSYSPDVVILDIGLPDMDGFNVIQTVRTWSQVPIIVVSARTHERDKVKALDMGADDYVVKPFSTSELLARVRTSLRHVKLRESDIGAMDTGVFKAGALTIDRDKRHAYINGEDIHLTQNEYRIVALLSKFAGRVLTYDYIIKSIWGNNLQCDNQILRVNMANIRRKLEKNPAAPEYIFTEMGVGYRMIEGD